MNSTEAPSENTENILMYVTVATAGLGLLSELLPFCSKCKGNGILQSLIGVFTAKIEENEPDTNVV